MAERMLALYGHPFSSYCWKALIALYANATPFEFRMVDPDHPDWLEAVGSASPLGKFPMLEDGENLIFESTTIIEYLDRHFPGAHQLLPTDPDAAIGARMLDRVFDNYVQGPMTEIVREYLLAAGGVPDAARIARAQDQLQRAYAWLDSWLQFYPAAGQITLIECSAAPALFYADWVAPIPHSAPRLQAWRAHLLALPPIAHCVDDARPFRAIFPPGAPDRD